MAKDNEGPPGYKKRWEKHIRDARPELPEGYKKYTLLAYCFTMATYGDEGRGCFAADETIRADIDLSNRKTVAGYRHLALELGWFVSNGKRHGRAKELDISIPVVAVTSAKVDIPAQHNWSIPIPMCPACEPLLERLRRGEITWDYLSSIHAGDTVE